MTALDHRRRSRRVARIVLSLTGAGALLVGGATPATTPGHDVVFAQAATPQAAPNTLTAEERAAGWKLLFDGTSFGSWRGYNRTEMPTAGWVVEAGTIKHVTVPATQTANAGDIITRDEFSDFEFQMEWKIAAAGNSGVKYLVDETLAKTGHSGVAFEMQVLDDERHPDAKAGKDGNRTAGSLYDLIPPTQHTARPVGDWNQARIVVKSGVAQQWLNGVKVVEFTIGSPRMKTLIADSKFKDIAGFGEVRRGHLLLQDHGDEVWFRNLKVK